MKLKKDFILIVIIFILAVAIRAWPEIKGGFWPIGYDTFNTYAPEILKFDGNFLRWILSANLLYFLIWPFYKIWAIDPYLLVKIFGPVLYGLLSVGFYSFCRKYLKWRPAIAFFAAVLFLIQLPSLRMSWELFRNMLGLIFFLPALYFLENHQKLVKLLLLCLLSILIVLSNELVAALWFVVVLVWFLRRIAKQRFQHLWQVLSIILPSVVLFGLVLKFASANNFGGHVIYLGDSNIIFGYIEVYKNTFSYWELTKIITSLFWFCYQFVLPFAILGFWHLRKNLILTTLTLWLLLGTFSSLIFGGYGLFVWSRWLWMLVIPFTIYATQGLLITYRWAKTHRKVSRKIFKASAALILILYLGVIAAYSLPFVITPGKDAKPPFSNPNWPGFFPPSLIHNAVGFDNINNVIETILYINQNTPDSSVVLIDNRYRGMVLTKMNYSKRYVYTYPWSDTISPDVLNQVRAQSKGPMYVIGSVYGTIAGFEKVFQSGQLAVFQDSITYGIYKALYQGSL
ncbi:hypothetical protein A2V71_03945 [Candidatus Berkelbacteria bacterium RBG_13_40_8]|uniref:Glycosyltransferase RgtA/B/C/D-like domain-containing protein n=1 Tax=Candidatus Berkelbacteria bacterium RBG_13_40_8 TaxID=1797467 RepID=A0A1F5DLT6_9BACT|nr:MAG: hypothetical protein A2V71_03945 [Candidatus Berkelbacteria bacterium RBG_13_40_8]